MRCLALATLAFPFLTVALPSAQLRGQSVTPTNGSVTVDPNTSGNQVVFTVTTGGPPMFQWSVQCTYGGQVTSCSAGLFSGKRTSGEQVTVTFAVGALGQGNVGLELYDGQFSVASGNYNVQVGTITYGVAVTPDGGSLTTAAFTSGNSASFTVQNTGNVSNTFTFTCARTGSVSSCSAPASVTLAAGASASRTVTYSTGGGGTGSVTLTASGTSASDNGSYNVTVPITYGVAVTPDGGSLTTPAFTSGNSASFTVQNTGNVSNTFTFSCARVSSPVR